MFPLLAAVPHGSPVSWLGWLLIVLAAIAAGAGMVWVLAGSGGWRRLLTDVLAAAAICGGILAALTALAAGGVGAGALRHVGASWWQVGGSAALAVALGAACSVGIRQLNASRTSVPLARAFQLRAVPSDRSARADGEQPSQAADDDPARAADDDKSGSGAQAPVSRSRHVS